MNNACPVWSIKHHIGCVDPYKDTKTYYNQFFLKNINTYDEKLHSMEDAVKYAVVANIIDFNPVHSNVDEEIQHFFSHIDTLKLVVNDVDLLSQDIQHAGSILYLGDNCGEICFDKLLIKRIKDLNPDCEIYFGVRGAAVVNDSTQEDVISWEWTNMRRLSAMETIPWALLFHVQVHSFKRFIDKQIW